MERTFSHLDAQGNVTMVDVGDKIPSKRVAIAEAVVELAPATLELLKKSALPKGDVLACAKIGGIMAAKRASQLIPLCHSLNLSYADIRFEVRDMPPQVRIEAEARTVGNTGVEMEALHAVSAAALTIYDMCKAIDRGMHITNLRVIEKDGGKSGHFTQQ